MKNKILFLIHALNGGGAQRVLLELVNNMDFEQYDVTIQTIYDRGELRHRLNSAIQYRTIIKTKNKYIMALESYYIRRIAKPEWTYRHFIENNYDYAVAFLEGECTRLIGGCANLKTKKIAWVHIDFMKLFTADGVFRNTNEHLYTYMKYDKIVCCSQDVAAGFANRFQHDFGQKLVVKYNVIDSERIIHESEECSPQLPQGIFNIVCVGNMREQKAYDRLLKICDKLVREGYRFRLTIIGSGSEFNKIADLQKQYNLGETVVLMGNQSNPYKYLKQADLFLLASYTEGFSTVLIEAIILEVPSIVTDCAGMNEILDNGKYGIIIPNTSEAIYNQLKSILNNPEQLEVYKKILPDRKYFFDKKHALQEAMLLFED